MFVEYFLSSFNIINKITILYVLEQMKNKHEKRNTYIIGTFEIVCVSYNCNLKYRQQFKQPTL